jgi:hypothetical protein
MTTTDTKTAITALRIKLPTAMDHVDTVEGDVDFDYEGVGTQVFLLRCREVFPAATEDQLRRMDRHLRSGVTATCWSSPTVPDT